MQISIQCLFCKKEIEINVSVTKNRTTHFSVWFLFMSKIEKRRDHRSPLLKMQNPKVKTKKFHIWILSHWLNAMKETQNFNSEFVLSCQTHYFVIKKLNLIIFVTLLEHSTSMHHQEIASSNMTKDRRQQSRVKRHRIYIRTVSSWRLFSALQIWFRLVYGPVGQSNM